MAIFSWGYNLLRDSKAKLELELPVPFYEFQDQSLPARYIEQIYDFIIEEWQESFSQYYEDAPQFAVYFDGSCTFPTEAVTTTGLWDIHGSDNFYLQRSFIMNKHGPSGSEQIGDRILVPAAEGRLSYFKGVEYNVQALPYDKLATRPFDPTKATAARVADGSYVLLPKFLEQAFLMIRYLDGLTPLSGRPVGWLPRYMDPTYNFGVTGVLGNLRGAGFIIPGRITNFKNLFLYDSHGRYLRTLETYPDITGFDPTRAFFTAEKWAINNAISTIDINHIRPTFIGLVKGKDEGEVIYLDLMKAKARKAVDDDCIIGRFIILDLNGEPFPFSEIFYRGDSSLEGYVFWGEESRILVTDYALNPTSEFDAGDFGDFSEAEQIIKLEFGDRLERNSAGNEILVGDVQTDHPSDARIQPVVITWSSGNETRRDAPETDNFFRQSLISYFAPVPAADSRFPGITAYNSDTYTFGLKPFRTVPSYLLLRELTIHGGEVVSDKENKFKTVPDSAKYLYMKSWGRFSEDTGFNIGDNPDSAGTGYNTTAWALLDNSNVLKVPYVNQLDEDNAVHLAIDEEFGDICDINHALIDENCQLNMPVIEPPITTVRANNNEITLKTLHHECLFASIFFVGASPKTTKTSYSWESLIIGNPYLTQKSFDERSDELVHTKEFVSTGIGNIAWDTVGAPPGTEIPFKGDDSHKIELKVPEKHETFRLTASDDYLVQKGYACLDEDKENRISQRHVRVWPRTLPVTWLGSHGFTLYPNPIQPAWTNPFYMVLAIQGINRQRKFPVKKIQISDPEVLSVGFSEWYEFGSSVTVKGSFDSDLHQCTYEPDTPISIVSENFRNRHSDPDQNTVQGLDPDKDPAWMPGIGFSKNGYGGTADASWAWETVDDYDDPALAYCNNLIDLRFNEGKNVSGVNDVIRLTGVKTGSSTITIEGNDPDSKTLSFAVEVWNVRAVGFEDDEDPFPTSTFVGNTIELIITGNSSYPHQWWSSDRNVAIVTPDPEDSRKATVTAMGPGTFHLRVIDSGKVPWRSLDITVS